MIEKYIEDGKFDRTQLAIDIKNGKISAEKLNRIFKEINEEVSSNNIDNPYIGTNYSDKKKKSEWNDKYLGLLVSEVSSAEVFNEDSMTYLLKVAKYVNSKGLRTARKTVLVLVGLCAVFAAGLFTGKTEITKLRKENEDLAKKVEQLEETNNVLITEKKELDSAVDVVINAASEFDKKYNELKNALGNLNSLKEKEDIKNEVDAFDEKKISLTAEIEKLKPENAKQKIDDSTQIPAVTNDSPVENVLADDVAPSASDKEPEEDELDKFINRALSGENVKAEFQKTDYSSADVEKRALDRKLTRKDAEKLVDNLANPNKFNVNKFGE